MNIRLPKAMILISIFLLFLTAPSHAQLLSIQALSDFYTIYGQMEKDGKTLNTPGDMKNYLIPEIKNKMSENISYRAAFIGQVAARVGFNTGVTSLQNIDTTIDALTGFLMLVEDNGDIATWTVREVSQKYDRLLQTSWQNVNPPLFTLILQTYCAYKRGELGW
jgi:hypothetical protein